MKKNPVEIWERLGSKLLGFWSQVTANEVITFEDYEAKPEWFPLMHLHPSP